MVGNESMEHNQPPSYIVIKNSWSVHPILQCGILFFVLKFNILMLFAA